LELMVNPQFVLEQREEETIKIKNNKKNLTPAKLSSEEISDLFEPKFHKNGRFEKSTMLPIKKVRF